MGSTRAKSAAPHMAMSAFPNSKSIDPMIIDVGHVAHAVIVDVIGPVESGKNGYVSTYHVYTCIGVDKGVGHCIL